MHGSSALCAYRHRVVGEQKLFSRQKFFGSEETALRIHRGRPRSVIHAEDARASVRIASVSGVRVRRSGRSAWAPGKSMTPLRGLPGGDRGDFFWFARVARQTGALVWVASLRRPGIAAFGRRHLYSLFARRPLIESGAAIFHAQAH